MDSPAASASPSPSTLRRRLEAGILILALLAYAAVIAAHLGVYAGGSDSSGYMNNARLILDGNLHIPQRAIEGLPPGSLPYFAYVPLGFSPVSNGAMVPTYPPGLSLLIAGMTKVTGPDIGPSLTIWLHAVLGVLVIYAWGRVLQFSRPASTLAALLIGACPLYLFNSMQALSDAPAMVWTAAAVYCAWRARTQIGWTFAAGVVVSIAVLIRPTNILVLLPVAFALGVSPQRWLGLIVGGLPGAFFLSLYNVRLYGKIVTTGYGDVSESFSGAFVMPALTNYAQWLPILLTPAVVLVLAMPFLFRRIGGRLIAMLTVWILGFTGFYSYYFFTAETWWALRFILPAFPACILGLMVVGRAITTTWTPRLHDSAVWIAIVATLLWDGRWVVQQSALEAAEGEHAFVEGTQWANLHIPDRAVVVCMQTSGALLYYTKFILLRYDFAGDVKAIDRACDAANRPIYASLYSFETQTALEERLPGKWTQVGTTRNVTFWRRDSSEPTQIEKFPWREFVTNHVGETEVTVETGPGWYGAEEYRKRRWTWSNGPARVKLETWPLMTGTLQLDFLLRSLKPMNVTVKQNDLTLWQVAVGTERSSHSVIATVQDGVAELEFTSDSPGMPESAAPGARVLTIGLYDLRVGRPSSK